MDSQHQRRQESDDSDTEQRGDQDQDMTTITAVDYLLFQAELEREAAETLPGKFDSCTFSKGYLNQRVYACLTCSGYEGAGRDASDEGQQQQQQQQRQTAGICYACSISCHTDHNIIELFTKRHFRCDCGTKRMRSGPLAQSRGGCTIKKGMTDVEMMAIENHENQYNHNFWGHYCRCDTLYDPETETGVMIQCYVCQDWYHDRCIGVMPPEDEYSDYICRECVQRYPLLRCLASRKLCYGVVDVESGKVRDLVHRRPGGEKTGMDSLPAQSDKENSVDTDEANSAEISNIGEAAATAASIIHAPKRKLDYCPNACQSADKAGRADKKKPRLSREETGCQHVDTVDVAPSLSFDIFAKEGWRSDICSCSTCVGHVNAQGLGFLLKDEPVFEPESDSERDESLYAAAMRHLEKYDRLIAASGAWALRELSDGLKLFLEPFASSGKVVTSEDIMAFFESRKSRGR